jgi:glycosyltransferase involved in cell wall biosynthesis
MSGEFAYRMTVVVPDYNAERHLGRCLASLDVQSAPQDAFEVVLVNDGSTDKSLGLCREAVAARPNYVLIDQPNQGVSAARNAGIRAARGRFITFVDADDALSKHAIERLVRTFGRYEDAVDLLTYRIAYVDVSPNNMRGHRRFKMLTKPVSTTSRVTRTSRRQPPTYASGTRTRPTRRPSFRWE